MLVGLSVMEAALEVLGAGPGQGPLRRPHPGEEH